MGWHRGEGRREAPYQLLQVMAVVFCSLIVPLFCVCFMFMCLCAFGLRAPSGVVIHGLSWNAGVSLEQDALLGHRLQRLKHAERQQQQLV